MRIINIINTVEEFLPHVRLSNDWCLSPCTRRFKDEWGGGKEQRRRRKKNHLRGPKAFNHLTWKPSECQTPPPSFCLPCYVPRKLPILISFIGTVVIDYRQSIIFNKSIMIQNVIKKKIRFRNYDSAGLQLTQFTVCFGTIKIEKGKSSHSGAINVNVAPVVHFKQQKQRLLDMRLGTGGKSTNLCIPAAGGLRAFSTAGKTSLIHGSALKPVISWKSRMFW